MSSDNESQNQRNVERLVSAIANQGVLLAKHMNRTQEAVPLLLRAFSMARDHCLTDLLPGILTSMNVVLKRLSQEAYSLMDSKPDAAAKLAEDIEVAASECDIPSRLHVAIGFRGMALQKLGNLSEALACFERKEAVCRGCGDKGGLHRSLTYQAQLFIEQNKLVEALIKLEEKYRICIEIDDQTGKIRALDMICDTQMRKGDGEDALESLEHLESLLHESGDYEKLAGCLNRKGLVLAALGETHKALEIRQKERRIYQTLGDDSGIRRSWANEALVLHQLQHHPGAAAVYSRLESDCSHPDLVNELTSLYTVQAKLLIDRDDIASAMMVYQRLCNYCKKHNHPTGIVVALINQAMLTGDRRVAQEALGIAKAHKIEDLIDQVAPIVERFREPLGTEHD